MNELDVKNIFTFSQYSAQFLADLLGKDKKTVYNYRDNINTIPFGKILILEKLINSENIVHEEKVRYKPSHEIELEEQVQKLKEEKDLLIRTINQLSSYNVELQNQIKK